MGSTGLVSTELAWAMGRALGVRVLDKADLKGYFAAYRKAMARPSHP
jgi:hypothetical protein